MYNPLLYNCILFSIFYIYIKQDYNIMLYNKVNLYKYLLELLFTIKKTCKYSLYVNKITFLIKSRF